MLAFVDESGDPGLKLGSGSSLFFVVALVVFEDHEEAEAAGERIGLLRRELDLHPRYEFRFNKCNRDLRIAFLKAISPYEFFYFGIVINKAGLWGKGFQYKGPFYKYVTGLVFQNATPYLERATVVLDGTGSREFRQQLQTYLRKKINKPQQTHVVKIKVQASANNNLIQLADMVAGAISRSFTEKNDAAHYRGIVAHREMYVQLWPKERSRP